ncbi:MAG: NADH-quinone oxidoreductase subunit I [Elusimicrobia bacterium]|nr:NADH-quinone oxidoreductase subunit I [Elusimicrobiota bacterium]
MISYLGRVAGDAWAVCKGLWVTLKTLVKPSITVQYPTEKLTPEPMFRGVLLYDVERCTACGLCVKACPSACISVQAQVNEAGKRVPKAAWYAIDLGRCNWCRMCEESCPFKPKVVWHSVDYELCFFSREEMVRCWKPGFPLLGKVHDVRKDAFVDPPAQIVIQEVPARHDEKGPRWD